MSTRPIPLDPFMEMILWLEQRTPASSNQVVVFSGRIAAARVEGALRRLVARVPLLRARARLSWRGGVLEPEAWGRSAHAVDVRRVAGPFALDAPPFRRALMAASAEDPVVWTRTPPLRVRVFEEADGGGSSALTLHTTHALGDIVTDLWLLRELLAEYGAGGDGGEAVARGGVEGAESSDGAAGGFVVPDLRDLAGAARTPRAAARRCLAGAAAMARCAVRRDAVWRPRAPGAGDLPPRRRCFSYGGGARLDFACEEVAPAFLRAARAGLRSRGATLNSFLAVAVARVIAESEGSRGRRGRRVRLTVPVSFRPAAAAEGTPLPGNHALPCDLVLEAGSSASEQLASVGRQVAGWRAGGVARELGRIEGMLPMMRGPIPYALGFRMAPLFLGSNVFFSNPGVLPFDPTSWSAEGLCVTAHAGMSTVLPPFVLTLFTPTRGGERMSLEALYHAERVGDGAATFLAPLRSALAELADELGLRAGTA